MTSSWPSTARAALELAVCAPSVHNTQPWRFEIHPDHIDVFADRRRHLPHTDPDGRDLLISCGIALHHLRVALGAFGYLAVTEHLPDSSRPDHLARVEPVPRPAQRSDLALAVCIPRRRSDRRPYLDRPLTDEHIADLVRAAVGQCAALQAVTDPAARAALTAAVADADTEQRGNLAYRYELAHWRRPAGDVDGVVATAEPAVATVGDLRLRTFTPVGHSTVNNNGGAGTLLVLGTAGDDSLSRLCAGEAASAVLLAATRARLASCPISQPLELTDTRKRVRDDVLGHVMYPQLVLRVGWPAVEEGLAPTGRRPLDEVLSEHWDD